MSPRPLGNRPPDVECRLPLHLLLALLNRDRSDKVFEYCRVKLQQSNIFLLKLSIALSLRSMRMRELTFRTDGATSSNLVHTALSTCLSSSDSAKVQI